MRKKQMDAEQREQFIRIMGLADRAYEAASKNMWKDVREAVRSIRMMQDALGEFLQYAYTTEILENIEDTLETIQRSVEAGDDIHADMKAEYQLLPFLKHLKEAFYFWCDVFPDSKKTKSYYQEEFAAHYSNPHMIEGDSAQYRMSIVVTGYNHLDMTKQCVEQLLKETDFDKLDAELILIDHGSTDGTLEYFESIEIGKVIRFKNNVRMYMFALIPQICKGEYFVFVSNDVLVTRNWAEILLECMDSDEKIITAIPAMPNTANLQMSSIPADSPEDFIQWANRHNKIDPMLYADRVRLMPPLGCYRTAAVNRIGFADPMFYTMEFWDDDFSLRARRNGYRQVICKGVACYHFGSVTGGEAHRKENTLKNGRQLFFDKHGVDAWGNGNEDNFSCYDPNKIKFVMDQMLAKDEFSVLGIDCGFGDTPLQIRNELRMHDRNCRIYNITCRQEFVPDLKMLSDAFVYESDLAEGLQRCFDKKQFDCICWDRNIAEYRNYEKILEVVRDRLSEDGIFVFSCSNLYYADNLYAFFCLTFPERMPQIHFMDFDALTKEVGQFFSSVQIAAIYNTPKKGQFISSMYGGSKNFENIQNTTSIIKYNFFCKK